MKPVTAPDRRAQPAVAAAPVAAPLARLMVKPLVPGRLAPAHLILGAAVAVLTAAQGILTIANSTELWLGSWPASSAILDLATLWGTCIAAAAAAWVVAAPRRHHYLPLVRASSRPQARVYLAGLSAVGIGNLIGYAVVLGYIVLTTGPEATHGHLNAIELLTPLAAVPMAVGMGAAVARIIPAMLAPLVAAITPYVTYGIFSDMDSYTNQIAFSDVLTDDQTDRDYLRLPIELLVSRAVFWTAVGIALVCWMALANRTAYSSAVIAGFAAAVVLLTAGTRIDVPQQYAVVCLDGAPRVCVDRAHDHLLQKYRDRVDTDLASIPGLDLSAFTVVLYPELFPFARKFTGHTPASGPQVPVALLNGNTTLAHEIDPVSLDANVGYGLFLSPCLTAPVGTTHAEAWKSGFKTAIVLQNWWLKHKHLPINGSNFVGEVSPKRMFNNTPGLRDTARRFMALSPADRTAWFTANQDAIMHCRAHLT